MLHKTPTSHLATRQTRQYAACAKYHHRARADSRSASLAFSRSCAVRTAASLSVTWSYRMILWSRENLRSAYPCHAPVLTKFFEGFAV